METHRAEFVRGVVSLEDLPRARIPEIAFSGRSNVGKSSLLNRLVGIHGLARTSRVPGKTREINFYSVADRFHLVDLPGYGYARVPTAARARWGPLVEGYLGAREQLAGIVQLVDLRHGPTDLDAAMLDWLEERGISALVAGTKADKLGRTEARERLEEIGAEYEPRGFAVGACSAKTGDGMKELWAWIELRRRAWNARPASKRSH